MTTTYCQMLSLFLVLISEYLGGYCQEFTISPLVDHRATTSTSTIRPRLTVPSGTTHTTITPTSFVPFQTNPTSTGHAFFTDSGTTVSTTSTPIDGILTFTSSSDVPRTATPGPATTGFPFFGGTNLPSGPIPPLTGNTFPSTQQIESDSQERLNLYTTLTTKYQVSKKVAISILKANRLPVCTAKYTCDENAKYRAIDGTCNNLRNPSWGSAFQEFNRLLPAAYPDGINQMANPWYWGWGPNGQLPNARLISSTSGLAARDDPSLAQVDPEITNMVPQFGQFVDHDMTFTPKQDQVCCSQGWNCGGDSIQVPDRDYFYNNDSTPRQYCLDFSRSTPFCFPTESGVREQFNSVTAYLDCSQVYGSTAERTRQLRLFSSGKLRAHGSKPSLLPYIQEVESALGISLQFQSYSGQSNLVGRFFAGDDRVNQNPALTALHTLFLREHNRLAEDISKFNPRWGDEEIFQQARRILIAEWQNIVYGEYLPIILGDNTMASYKLKVGTAFTNYKVRTDATIFNSFATAAYRFGHSMISGLVQMVNVLKITGTYQLRDNYFNADKIEQENGFKYLMGGLMTQNSQAFDPYYSEDVTNYLFKEKEKNYGSDLVARNIQRGRDHGLPTYNEYRKLCGLSPLTPDWTNKPDDIGDTAWASLQTVGYSSPLVIDLFVGGMSEDPFNNGVVGPTFNCIQAMQFQKVKDGDRFFFTHSEQTGSFTTKQLAQIRRRKLGDIICDDTDIKSVTINVFKVPSRSNPWKSCQDVNRPRINFADFYEGQAQLESTTGRN